MTLQSGLPATTKPVIKKLSPRHKRVLDFMIRNPELRLAEIAKELDYTVPWISTIANSELFKAEYNRRRAVFEEQDNKALSIKLNNIAHKGLDHLMEHISDYQFDEEDGEDLINDGPSFQEVKQVTELALKASGYLGGSGKGNITINDNRQTQNNVVTVAQSTLEKARERLINGTSKVIEHQA